MTRRLVMLLLFLVISTLSVRAQVDLPSVRTRATAGDADAQFTLGALYKSGEGVARDDIQAAAWYRRAADQGHVHAQFALGWMYFLGQGMSKDLPAAHMWCNLAALGASGNDQQTYAAGRDFVARDMTPGQLTDAQRMATEWQAAFSQRRRP